MFETFILTLVFIVIMVAAMAVGVIFSNKPIKGSCGGIQNLGLGGKCDICGGDTQKCEEENNKQKRFGQKTGSSMFYDAFEDKKH